MPWEVRKACRRVPAVPSRRGGVACHAIESSPSLAPRLSCSHCLSPVRSLSCGPHRACGSVASPVRQRRLWRRLLCRLWPPTACSRGVCWPEPCAAPCVGLCVVRCVGSCVRAVCLPVPRECVRVLSRQGTWGKACAREKDGGMFGVQRGACVRVCMG